MDKGKHNQQSSRIIAAQTRCQSLGSHDYLRMRQIGYYEDDEVKQLQYVMILKVNTTLL